MKFEQILVYDHFENASVEGVLSFKVADVLSFFKEKADNQGLVKMRLRCSGSSISYRVKYDDLKAILNKEEVEPPHDA